MRSARNIGRIRTTLTPPPKYFRMPQATQKMPAHLWGVARRSPTSRGRPEFPIRRATARNSAHTLKRRPPRPRFPTRYNTAPGVSHLGGVSRRIYIACRASAAIIASGGPSGRVRLGRLGPATPPGHLGHQYAATMSQNGQLPHTYPAHLAHFALRARHRRSAEVGESRRGKSRERRKKAGPSHPRRFPLSNSVLSPRMRQKAGNCIASRSNRLRAYVDFGVSCAQAIACACCAFTAESSYPPGAGGRVIHGRPHRDRRCRWEAMRFAENLAAAIRSRCTHSNESPALLPPPIPPSDAHAVTSPIVRLPPAQYRRRTSLSRCHSKEILAHRIKTHLFPPFTENYARKPRPRKPQRKKLTQKSGSSSGW